MQNEWRNKWALVTGASAGIGVALATELAAGGTHLVLTARRRDRLEALGQSLKKAHAIETEVFAADLVERDAPQKIYAFTRKKGLAIELLVLTFRPMPPQKPSIFFLPKDSLRK